MKVFEVITEHCEDGSDKLITTRQYVISDDDSMKTVVDHFTRHCVEFDKELKAVQEVVTVTERIPQGAKDE